MMSRRPAHLSSSVLLYVLSLVTPRVLPGQGVNSFLGIWYMSKTEEIGKRPMNPSI